MGDLIGCYWKYISEGNVHIVLQLTNTPYVLRLIKEDKNPTSLVEVQNSTKFVNEIITPLLLGKINNEQKIIELSEYELSQLSINLHDLRPENRRFKSRLSPYAVKTMNLAMLDSLCHTNYCVEIKPKEGFLAETLKALNRCYYCLKQHLKLDLHQIHNKSEYCPLDLFSGERNRMKKALTSLAGNPQNNFKVFKEGKLIYHENSKLNDLENIVKGMNIFKSVNIFYDFLIQVLLSNENQYTSNLTETPEYKHPELPLTTKCIESTKLLQLNKKHKPFLHKLLDVQKLSNSLKFDLTNVGIGKEYVAEILRLIEIEGLDLSQEMDQKAFLEKADPVHLAMISAVAKDCSIMISFSPEYIAKYTSINIGNQKIPYRVSITDLESKSVESLLRRKKTEGKMIDAYKKFQRKASGI